MYFLLTALWNEWRCIGFGQLPGRYHVRACLCMASRGVSCSTGRMACHGMAIRAVHWSVSAPVIAIFEFSEYLGMRNVLSVERPIKEKVLKYLPSI